MLRLLDVTTYHAKMQKEKNYKHLHTRREIRIFLIKQMQNIINNIKMQINIIQKIIANHCLTYSPSTKFCSKFSGKESLILNNRRTHITYINAHPINILSILNFFF